MAVEAEYLITALILPIYPMLFMINRRIGKYDQVCQDVQDLEKEIQALWAKINEVE